MTVTPVAGRFVGQSIKRKEDLRLLTGHGEYVDDVVLANMWHGAFLRSNVASGRIMRLDVAAAASAPGVRAVFTGAELEAAQGEVFHSMIGGVSSFPFRPLANGDVRFVGDPVALVVADSRYAAEDACELIEVEYEVREPVLDYTSAGEPERPIVNAETQSNILTSVPFMSFSPDLEEAFAAAAHVVAATIVSHRYINVPMEGRGIVASWHPGRGELEVVMATQAVHQCQEFFAHYLGVPQAKITVSMRDVGGGFGQKMFVGREEAAIVLATRALGVPVKWVEDRRENLLAVLARPQRERGCCGSPSTPRGSSKRSRVEDKSDIGAYPIVPAAMNTALLPGPYKIPAARVRLEHAVHQHHGQGRLPGAMDVRDHGPRDDDRLRRPRDRAGPDRGASQEPPRHVPTCPTPSAGPVGLQRDHPGRDPRAGLEHARTSRRSVASRRRRVPRDVGSGWGSASTSSRAVDAVASLGTESATVRVESNGEVTVLLGSSSHGQGIETTMAQIVADTLGVDFDTVTVVQGTTHTPFGPGTGGHARR